MKKERENLHLKTDKGGLVIETKVVIGWFKEIELSNNKLSDNKLSDTNLASESVENRSSQNQSQSRKL